MDIQTYKVAVHLILNDEITRNMVRISEDALKLNERFEQMQKVIKTVTSASNGAAKAITKMNAAMNGQFGGAVKGAKEYAETVKSITKNANEAVRSLQQSNRSVGGSLTPYAIGGALMIQASAGGRGAIPPGYNLSTNSMPFFDPRGLPNYGGGRIGIGHNGSGGGGYYSGSFRHVDADFPPSPPGGGSGGSGGGNGGGGNNFNYSHADAVAGMAAGYFGIRFIDKVAEKSLDYERDLARLRQMGLSSAQLDSAQKYADSTGIANTSRLDRLRLFTDAQGSFRESGLSDDKAMEAAIRMMPIMARYEVASGLLSGSSHAAADYNMKNLNKIVEIMGGLSSTSRASAIVDSVFKSSQASGRLVDENQLKQFVAYGSSATNSQKLRTIFGGLEPIIGEMGGSTTAVGLRTAYTRVNGMMSLPPKLLLKEMHRLGMLDETGIKQTDALHELQATSVTDYAKKIMSIYKSHGITKTTDMERENAILFGTNGSKIFNRIMAQMSTIDESFKAYDKAVGADKTANDPNNNRLLAMQRMQKKWEDFELVLGKDGGVLDLFTRALDKLGNAIQRITLLAQQHPTLTKLAIEGASALSAIGLVGGGVVLFSHSLRGMIKPFELLGVGVSKLTGLGAVASDMNSFGGAMLKVTPGIIGFTAAIAALAALDIVRWYNDDKEDVHKQLNSGAMKGPIFMNDGDAANQYRRLLEPSKYPPIPGKSLNKDDQPVNLYMTDQGKKVLVATVTREQTKQASRPQTGMSGFDNSMYPAFPGASGLILNK